MNVVARETYGLQDVGNNLEWGCYAVVILPVILAQAR